MPAVIAPQRSNLLELSRNFNKKSTKYVRGDFYSIKIRCFFKF
jgi:hypothetical protein